MKFFRITALSCFLSLALLSCSKKSENTWNVEIKKPVRNVQVVDISKEFYNADIPLEEFQQKFPWFQGTVSDADFVKRRNDKDEEKIYREALSKIDINKLNKNLENLFSHIRYYFPTFKVPTVFLYSSALQSVTDPVFYKPAEHMLFIDISGFMGDGNAHYQGLEKYYQISMNPQNIIPKASEIIAESFVPYNRDHQKFLDQLVYQGKIMTLQDAFLPGEPDYLKINYTKKQYDWAKTNEVNIWNYFVENDLLFSDDPRLAERFIVPGPFSKFYTEIDNESSPQLGIFIGWQICRKFLNEKPDTKLQDFLKMNAQEIFNQAQYSPKFEK